jgi:hypothetical protein
MEILNLLEQKTERAKGGLNKVKGTKQL